VSIITGRQLLGVCAGLAGRRFRGALWMNGYPAVRGCEVDVKFVRCRRQLKYIIYEILHRKERKGRKASAVGSFAVFAHFAVRY